MKTNIYYNKASMDHKLYPFFSEKPRRLEALVSLFKEQNRTLINSKIASVKDLELAHKKEYIEHIRSISQMGLFKAFVTNTFSSYIQWYTRVSKGSFNAALYSVGGVTQAVEDTLSGKTKRAFCLARPPGHHAGVEKGEGFCIFNSVTIGALTALKNGAQKVAIIDFDRHHGNGTEEIVTKRGEGKILFISSFQDGCKYSNNSIKNDNIIPIPIPEYSSFDKVKNLYKTVALPKLYEFKPDLILISAGFDMHIDDPLTNIKLHSKDFYDLTKLITDVADDICDGKVVSALEGGYDVKALSECVGYHIEALDGK
jgi:acetoin utilization deacetylase AcuC-like enzyme